MTLADARKKSGFTQEEAACKLGISRSFFGLIEQGKRRPDYGLAKKVSELYKQKLEDIFFDYERFKMNLKI